MIVNDSKKVPTSSGWFNCELCDYSTCRKSQYQRHLSTDKHKKTSNDSKMIVNGSNLVLKSSKIYNCLCGKLYKYDSGYYRHKKVCIFKEDKQPDNQPTNLNFITPELVMELIKNNKEFQILLQTT